MSKHTPTPWHVIKNKVASGQTVQIKSSTNSVIALMKSSRGRKDFNAEHIVKCVNEHEKLLECIERLNGFVRRNWPHGAIQDALCKESDEILEKHTKRKKGE